VSIGTYRAASAFGFDDEEIHQIAWQGVLKSAKKFNPNHLVNGKPVQFASYAVWGIRQAVQKATHYGKDSAKPMNGAKLVSANAPISNSEGDVNELISVLADPKQDTELLDEKDRIEAIRKYIQKALAGLPSRDRTIIECRFGINRGDPASLHSIGEELGISKERVRQIEQRAMAQLHEQLRARETIQGSGID
jgi:RNA polymerase sigma factor (sigma-70 family)